jgi:hypothetical protein
VRAVALAIVLAGCSDRDCSIDAVEYDFAGTTLLDSCGDFSHASFDTPMSAYQAAQACVLDHVQQHRAFFVGFINQGVDTWQYGAYIGLMHDGAWELAEFGQWQGIHGKSPAERDSCTDVIAQPGFCDTWRRDLCLQCVGAKVADQCEP